MILREFKVWGRKRGEKDSLYIWAKDADDAIGIARLTDQSICASQWTGNEKSYEEALEQEPCDDAISRAEAEAIFRNARSKLNPSDYKTADEFNTRDLMLLNAEQFIHMLPSVKQQEPKWIPVSERLPKADEYNGDVAKYYLVQNEYGDMLVARYTHSDYWEQIYQLKPISDEVVAWMPLPEPYKAESEDKE